MDKTETHPLCDGGKLTVQPAGKHPAGISRMRLVARARVFRKRAGELFAANELSVLKTTDAYV